jgi:hypothetical protein
MSGTPDRFKSTAVVELIVDRFARIFFQVQPHDAGAHDSTFEETNDNAAVARG